MVLGVVQKEQSPSCLCDLSAVIGPGYIYERKGVAQAAPDTIYGVAQPGESSSRGTERAWIILQSIAEVPQL